ncbi:hypothetical protein K3495_g16946, partial [Podosphaera aphanis]
MLAVLDDQSVHHTFTKEDKFQQILPQEPIEAFTFDGRYSADQFQGIMPDTGAAGVSTAGLPQFEALQKICGVKLDTSTAGGYKIRFGKGSAESLGTTWVNTPVGIINFHVVPTNTPFLFCIQDMDKMGVYLNNIENILLQGNKKVPIIRKWGHPFMLLDQMEQTLAFCHLTEVELRQLHRRFGHPSVHRLSRVLKRAGHKVENGILERLS